MTPEHRRFRRARIRMILALIALVLASSPAWLHAQDRRLTAAEVCALIPASAAELIPSGSGAGCSAVFAIPEAAKQFISRKPNINWGQNADPQQAQYRVTMEENSDPLARITPVVAYGDRTLEWLSTSYNHHSIRFFRRCYAVLVDWNTTQPWYPVQFDPESTIRPLVAQLDERLKTAPCPPPIATATPTETIVNIRDPSTGSWVPWLLVPGIGLVLWVAGKLIARKKPTGETITTVGQTKQEKPEERKVYDLDIRTQDNRMSLTADGEDILWVYSQVRCNQPEVNTEALTLGITFTATGADAQWLSLGPPQPRDGYKAVPVRARPPSQDAQLTEGKATVVVSTVLDGTPINSPVNLDLQAYTLEFF